MMSSAARFAFGLVLFVAACGDSSTSGGGGGGTPSDGGGAAGGSNDGGAPATDGGGGSGGADATGGAGGAIEGLCGADLPVVSFAADVQPIFTSTCAKSTCHAGTQPDGSLDLREGAAHAELTNVSTSGCSGDRTRIVPGDPDESYLFDKIRGVDLCGTSHRMPPSPNPMLSDEQIAIFEAWICAGAKDD
ncbi:MAG: PE-PGRS family protein [Polyangiaceae bacterium]|nr:PE-PGRS family protein [Polyangiaceae bacterium]